MTVYELCRSYRRIILNRTAKVMNYDWDSKFCLEQIKEVPDLIKKQGEYEPIDPNDLTEKEMSDLGFVLWSDKNPIRLIPLWLYPFLKDEFSAGSISDDPPQMIKKSEMDLDVRFGCLAYGVLPKKE